ncbi:hypothetical protein B9Z19DRAFT_977489 [Tuber borchii]|uniref:VWFA domain-containing protein n=1 Tax=Tuber borchii TaxID=42251 RepID=A0A2T6ZWK7_TUBBO|nr:hypothetical protein B9Z19DRAFT_977489 [Tuber borchii]
MAPLTRGQAKGALWFDGTEREQRASPEGQESSDSDFTDGEDGPPREGGNTDNQKPTVERLKGKLIPNGEEIGERLMNLIKRDRKGLQKIYGETEAELDKNLRAPIKRGEEMARKLITEMGCGYYIATDLTVLTLYDVVILIDDSDSMAYEENGARKETVIQFIDYITEICSMANESDILAMRFTKRAGGQKKSPGKSQEYLGHHRYSRMAGIGAGLKEILDEFVIGNPNQNKPLLVLTVTDGAGQKKGHLKNVIRDCVNERAGAGKGFDAVSFQFSRIGNDPGAAQLLIDLDQDPEIGEYIDVLPVEFDLPGQLEDKWFVLPKVLIGAILPDAMPPLPQLSSPSIR